MEPAAEQLVATEPAARLASESLELSQRAARVGAARPALRFRATLRRAAAGSVAVAVPASGPKVFAIVATTLRYFRAVAAISETCPDIITTGIRAVASFSESRSQT
jgi:hypothetical protein